MFIRSLKELVRIDDKVRTMKYEFDKDLGFHKYVNTIIDKNKVFEVTKYNNHEVTKNEL